MDEARREQLDQFGLLANKQLIAHQDWQRFYQFVIDVHRSHPPLPSEGEVLDALHVYGFSEHNLRRLMTVYNEGRELLEAYDRTLDERRGP